MIYCPCDIEADALEIEDVSKIHVFSMNWRGKVRSTNDYDKMRDVVQREDITLVGHNFMLYDVPVLEKILGVEVRCQIIDTLPVSWYLYPKNLKHGLEYWGEQLGVKKPLIEDWENLSYEEYKTRAEEDVAIQTLLWEKMQEDLQTLYDGDRKVIESLLRYLTFKMKIVQIQHKHPFKLDLDKLHKNLSYLEGLRDEKIEELKSVMPTVGVKSLRKPPKVMYKKDGSLSANGIKWKNLTEEHNLPLEHSEPIEVVKDYDEPNPQSPQQIKDWLFSLGWKPQIYNEGVNGKVPTYIKPDKSLCESILKLGEDVKHLDELGVIKHRIGLLKGFLRDQRNGYISCSIHGLASTLRTKHARLVNLPKPNVPYGELIRGVLTCDEGYELVDSDLASLEAMVKLDLIYPLNPDKVKEQLGDDFDSHLEIAVLAGLMSEEEVQYFKDCKKNNVHSEEFERLNKIRHKAKTCNYSAQYGVGKAKLAKTLEIKQAEAAKLLEAYKNANIESIMVAKSFKTKESLGLTWIQNPYNKFWYVLRSDKDRLSAVIQGTGDYITHLWAKYITDVSGCMSMVYHDQVDLIVKKGYRKGVEKLIKDSIEKVNKAMNLNVPMSVSVNFGDYFDEIH